MRVGSRFVGVVSLALASCAFGVVFGTVFAERILFAFVPPAYVPESAAPEFRLMAEAWNTIRRYYVDRTAVEPRNLGYGAITGMVDSLGDTGHSSFLTPEMVKESRNELQGQFEGIGAEVQMKDGRVVVVAPMDGSPAQKAGVRPGDVIVEVDGKEVTTLSLPQVVQRILGPAGTNVILSLLTPATGETRDVTVKRAHITVRNITWNRLPETRIAHIRIATFSSGVTEDLRVALKEVRKEDSSVLLDLRNDPGGLLDEAIGVASEFLKSGNVLIEKNADGQVSPVPVRAGGLAVDLPLVVLVNEGTASAAEIVAGAIQAARRAVVVGDTTFGTGTVLSEFPLSDGSALLIATGEWLTPAGRAIWHEGIKPDVPIRLPPGVEPLFPAEERGMTPDQLRSTKDEQLRAALERLEENLPAELGRASGRRL